MSILSASISRAEMSEKPYSKAYMDWVEWMKVNKPQFLPITNAQRKFVEWALKPENVDMVAQIGDMGTMFLCVRSFIRE